MIATVPKMLASVSVSGLMDAFLKAGTEAVSSSTQGVAWVVVWLLVLAFLAWVYGLLH